MNIYVFNPIWVTTSTFNSLCDILKVTYIYNLIKEDYIDLYLSESTCEIDFNIRSLKSITENSYKAGVHVFINRISDPVFMDMDNSLISIKLKNEIIDIDNCRSNPIYNIIHSTGKHVLVLQNNMVYEPNGWLETMHMSGFDFVNYAQKIILKYSNKEIQMSNAITGICINEYLFPYHREDYFFSTARSKWLTFRIRSKISGDLIDSPMKKFLSKEFKKLLYPNGDYDRKMLKKILTEEGFRDYQYFIKGCDEYFQMLINKEAKEREEEEREFLVTIIMMMISK